MLNRSHDLVIFGVLFLLSLTLLPVQAEELEFSKLRKSKYSLRGRVYDPRSQRVRRKTVFISGERLGSARGEADLDIDGLMLPGLIDLHEHVRFAYAPRFRGLLWPWERRFANRYEWQQVAKYTEFIDKHYDREAAQMKAVELFGLLREAVGGTTSLANDARKALDSVVIRNLSGPSKAHDDDYYLEDAVFFLVKGELFKDPPVFEIDASALGKIRSADRVLLHLAEGRRDDELTAREIEEFFAWAEGNPLLAKKIVPVHVVGFKRHHFRKLRDLGIDAVVWSPVSNMTLYGQTMDVPAALAEGMTVALGTDWYPSGSDSLFDELRFAKIVARRNNWKLKNRVLNDMILRNPAQILGSKNLGRLKKGWFSDLVVIPWRGTLELSLSQADVDNVELVVVGGRPLFGSTQIMEKLLENSWPSPIRPEQKAYGLNFKNSLLDLKLNTLEPLTETFLAD